MSDCPHPALRVDGACYRCCKARAGLLEPRVLGPLTEAQELYVGLRPRWDPTPGWRAATSLYRPWDADPPAPWEGGGRVEELRYLMSAETAQLVADADGVRRIG